MSNDAESYFRRHRKLTTTSTEALHLQVLASVGSGRRTGTATTKPPHSLHPRLIPSTHHPPPPSTPADRTHSAVDHITNSEENNTIMAFANQEPDCSSATARARFENEQCPSATQLPSGGGPPKNGMGGPAEKKRWRIPDWISVAILLPFSAGIQDGGWRRSHRETGGDAVEKR